MTGKAEIIDLVRRQIAKHPEIKYIIVNSEGLEKIIAANKLLGSNAVPNQFMGLQIVPLGELWKEQGEKANKLGQKGKSYKLATDAKTWAETFMPNYKK